MPRSKAADRYREKRIEKGRCAWDGCGLQAEKGKKYCRRHSSSYARGWRYQRKGG